MKLFLRLPFKKQKYRITEGWIYSDQEFDIHSFCGHCGIDFALPYGTELYAIEDGLAISSYFSRKLHHKYKNKDVWFGLGYFVQIYYPKYGRFSIFGHFSTIDSAIKFHKPKKDGRFYWPVGHKVLPEKLPDYSHVTKVKKGQLIGLSGTSGLGWGCSDYPTRTKKFISWDEPHLHFEIFRRVGTKRVKQYADPYGIKEQESYYPDSYRLKNRGNMGKNGDVLWQTDKDGMPKFIK